MPASRPNQKFLLVLGTGMLMVVCGVGAFVWTLTYLMALGTKFHGNYEYYGGTPAVYVIFVAGALGFAAPGLIVWYLCNRPIPQLSGRFSLRTMLIVVTVVALLIGVVSVLYRLRH